MKISVPNDKQASLNQKDELSLFEIMDFFILTWKKLLIAGLVGAALSFSAWWIFGNFTAEYILLNNNNTNVSPSVGLNAINMSPSTYALDIVSWKTIQKSLPNLAAQVEAEGKAPEGLNSLYKNLSNDQWWQKNVVPSYALSKADTKDLAGVSKDLDAASTTILSLTLTSSGSTKDQSLENVRAAAKFLRTGGAYLQLRNILNSYEGDTISSVAEIQKKITTTEIEINYLVQRAKSLEELHKRFPNSSAVGQQVVDPKDSGAKYLPLSTQIIAVNNEINMSKENLQRLRDRLNQIALIKTFIGEAIPLAESSFDGLVLGAELLKIEERLRMHLAKGDVNGQEILDQLHSQLLQVQARFTKGLEANTAPTSKKQGVFKAIAGGLLAGVFLMLIVMLIKRMRQNINKLF